MGDRPFTDIVYGNKNGFFTILTEPLSLAEEPLVVRQVRHLNYNICELNMQTYKVMYATKLWSQLIPVFVSIFIATCGACMELTCLCECVYINNIKM